MEETLLSRPEMEETLKSGTSTGHHGPSDQDQTTNHGTFITQERATICKYGAQTRNGGRSSDMKENTSSTSRARRHLMFQEEKMLKDNQFGSGASTVELTRDGQ
jgi:hypothetical protein